MRRRYRGPGLLTMVLLDYSLLLLFLDALLALLATLFLVYPTVVCSLLVRLCGFLPRRASLVVRSSLDGESRHGEPSTACPSAGVSPDGGSWQERGLLCSGHSCSGEKNTSEDDMWDP